MSRYRIVEHLHRLQRLCHPGLHGGVASVSASTATSRRAAMVGANSRSQPAFDDDGGKVEHVLHGR